MVTGGSGAASHLNTRSVRDHNLSLVLHTLARSHGCSRSVLGEATGLTPGAVTLLVNELLDAGFIETSAQVKDEGGRRKKQLVLSGRSYPVAVVQLGLTSARVACETFAGTALVNEAVDRDFSARPPEDFAAFCADALEDIAARLAGRDVGPLRAAGILVPASVLSDDRTVLGIPAFGWGMVDLGGLVHEALAARGLELPTVVLSDGACAGWAEYVRLVEKTQRVSRGLLYVSSREKIDGACIASGRIYRGALGTAVGLGHVQMEPEGAPCACGKRGCLSVYAGASELVQAAGLSAFERAHGRDAALREVSERARAGEPRARRAVDRAARYMRVAIENALTLLNADHVIMDGLFADYLDAILAVDNGFSSLGLPGITDVSVSELGSEASMAGALMRMRGALMDHAGALSRAEPLSAATLLNDCI